MCVRCTLQELGGHVYFAQFETRKMQKFLENMRERGVVDASTVVYGTGGGARKYAGNIKELLDVRCFAPLGCARPPPHFIYALQWRVRSCFPS